MSARADMAAKVAALKADGLNALQIAARLGIGRSYAYELLTDPEGVKIRARKASYRGKCKQCGAPTDGSNGPAGVPDYCRPCAIVVNTIWTEDTVVDAIHTFADRYGRQPVAMDWFPNLARRKNRQDLSDRFYRDGCWPYVTSVVGVFGRWSAAIEAAGFEPNPAKSAGPGSTSPEAYQRTVQMYRDGVPLADIAERCGITVQGVQYRLRYLGEPVTRHATRALTDLQLRRIARLYSDGFTGAEVAAEVGCSVNSVYRALRRQSVTLRGRWPSAVAA